MKFTGILKGKIEIPFVVEADNIAEATQKALEIPVRLGYKIEYITPIGNATPTPAPAPKPSIFSPPKAIRPSEWELREGREGAE